MNLTRWSAGLVSEHPGDTASDDSHHDVHANACGAAGGQRKTGELLRRAFPPMRARLTKRGWPKGLLKIQMPIRILLCRNSTKCGERARPPKRTLRLQVACRHRATPAVFPVNISRTLSCLPRCFSSPVPRESSSSAECVSSHSLLLWRFSYLPLCGQPCYRGEGMCEPAPT